MSVNILVFDKSKAPTEPMEFLRWFHAKAQWNADRDYNDIQGTTQPLADYFLELVKEYPSMNGKYAPSDEDLERDPELEIKMIDFTIDDDLIYMGVSYSADGEVFDRIEELAYKHGLGFCDMFFIYSDKETKVRLPQISPEDTNKQAANDPPKKKGLFARIFGKK